MKNSPVDTRGARHKMLGMTLIELMAVVVVIGWRDAVGNSGFLPLSALKLRRGTFECFAGRGAVAQVTRRNRDFQINVMVGDKASAETVEDALAAARSFALVPRG